MFECLRKNKYSKCFHHASKRPDSLLHAFCCVCGERTAEKAYAASISQAGSGEAVSNFEFRHGAVTTGAGPAQHRQTNSSTAAAAAAVAGGAEVAVAMAPPDELRHSSSARPGSITTIITTTQQPVFYELF